MQDLHTHNVRTGWLPPPPPPSSSAILSDFYCVVGGTEVTTVSPLLPFPEDEVAENQGIEQVDAQSASLHVDISSLSFMSSAGIRRLESGEGNTCNKLQQNCE
nr:uncharacterized protein LOC123761700 [Procambarus clarkii]